MNQCQECLVDKKDYWGKCNNPKCEEMFNARMIEEAKGMDSSDVFKSLKRFNRWDNFMIDEYTYGNLRIDALFINTNKKWIRGFEIKVSRQDFLNDEKWQLYSQFCSSLSIACPWGLIEKKEIVSPYGLIWVGRNGEYQWVKKPKNFQKREAMAWMLQYYKVMEYEFKRRMATT